VGAIQPTASMARRNRSVRILGNSYIPIYATSASSIYPSGLRPSKRRLSNSPLVKMWSSARWAHMDRRIVVVMPALFTLQALHLLLQFLDLVPQGLQLVL
jgi:hypothetical protein